MSSTPIGSYLGLSLTRILCKIFVEASEKEKRRVKKRKRSEGDSDEEREEEKEKKRAKKRKRSEGDSDEEREEARDGANSGGGHGGKEKQGQKGRRGTDGPMNIGSYLILECCVNICRGRKGKKECQKAKKK